MADTDAQVTVGSTTEGSLARVTKRFKEWVSGIHGEVVGAVLMVGNTVVAVGSGVPTLDDGPATEGTDTYTTSADMTTAAAIAPVPTSAKKSRLLQVTISVDTAMSVTIQSSNGTPVVYQKFYMTANSTVIWVPRHPPLLNVADERWNGLASASGNVAIHTTVKDG